MSRLRGALAMEASALPGVVTPGVARRLRELLDIDTSVLVTADDIAAGRCADIDVLITGWGAPALTSDALDALPALRAIIHSGGATDFISPRAWDRGIAVSTAALANARPVAEFTIALITLAAKDAFRVSREYSAHQRPIQREAELPHVGLNGTAVGIVGASRIGSIVLDRLAAFDVDRYLYDPMCDPARAASLGAVLLDDVADLASRCRILSLHAPALPATRGMISRRVLAAMPDGATLVNTARGSLVDQDALVDEVASGRLQAVLDVTEPEVLPAGHPLYTLPGVFLTPHLAGSAGVELRRLGAAAADEVVRVVAGLPVEHPAPRTVEHP